MMRIQRALSNHEWMNERIALVDGGMTLAEANAELDRREREKTAIHAVDPSLLKSSEWIFARNRERLLELKSEMGKQQTLIAQSNDAVGRMWFLNQMKVLDAYVEFLRRHEIFNPRCGGQLLDWIERSGNPAITIFVLEDAYNHLLCRAPAEPETPPTIITQPQSITVAPLEQAEFSVVCIGWQPLDCQWMINVQPIPGEHAKRARYQTTTSEYNDGALFCCRISNKFGSIFLIQPV